jgi:hypothetical protein
MTLIASLRQSKGQYSEAFVMANEARSVIRVSPTPIEYWLATSDAADNQLIEQERGKNPRATLIDILNALAARFPNGASGGAKGGAR